MKVLLDTHILIWAHTNSSRLSAKAVNLIQRPGNEVFYSSVSIWETEIKYLRDKAGFPISGEVLATFCALSGMRCLPLKPEHSLLLKTLSYAAAAPRPHKDPFDRILICQAKAENMLFVTHDELIPYYNEQCVVPV